MKRTNTEPVLTVGLVQAAIMGAINIAVVLRVVTLDADQLGVINASLGSILAVLLAVWARGRVTPV